MFGRFTFSGLASAMAFSASAIAADLPSRLDPLPPPPVLDPVPVASWSGFYAGASAGVNVAIHNWATNSLQSPATTAAGVFNPATARASLDSTRFRAAGHIGYNFQISEKVVAGLEADLGGPFFDSHRIQGVPGTFDGATLLTSAGNADLTRGLIRWDASIRGRFGVLASPNALFYATGGVAFASTRYGITCPGVYPAGSWCTAARSEFQSPMRTGWTIGAGVDAMLSDPSWLVRAEYRYSDYGSITRTFFSGVAGDAVTTRIALRTHTFSLGLSYKFGEKPAPLVARY